MRKRKYQAAAGVWGMLARVSIYRILGILFIMGVAQVGLFCGRMRQVQEENLSFERMLGEAGAGYVFLAAFSAVFLILLWTQGEHGGRSRYTLLRLPLTWRQILALRALYNLLCFVLVFAVQTGLVLGLAGIYRGGAGPERATGQMVFLAFYRSEFLHNLWPMAELGKWLRNLLMLLALSLEAAAGHRRKGYGRSVPLLIVVAAWVFRSETGINLRDAFCDLLFLIVAGADLWVSLGSGEEPEHEED
ncbi:MAG: hypothetical protein NC432_08255 [Roseburia sp.]|nr:hypothetical protein [Roseburia sp.]MCM1098680.1 hypothetical protein [Ruminococcus flavefaciens]